MNQFLTTQSREQQDKGLGIFYLKPVEMLKHTTDLFTEFDLNSNLEDLLLLHLHLKTNGGVPDEVLEFKPTFPDVGPCALPFYSDEMIKEIIQLELQEEYWYKHIQPSQFNLTGGVLYSFMRDYEFLWTAAPEIVNSFDDLLTEIQIGLLGANLTSIDIGFMELRNEQPILYSRKFSHCERSRAAPAILQPGCLPGSRSVQGVYPRPNLQADYRAYGWLRAKILYESL